MSQVDAQLDSLAQLRKEIEAIGRAANDPVLQLQTEGPASFGVVSSLLELSQARKAVDEIIDSIQALLDKLVPVAKLESTRDGLTVKTAIHYAGRVDSVWSATSNPESVAALSAEYLDELQKTYALRASFAQTLGVAGGTLLQVALAVANPVGNVPHALASVLALKRALQSFAATVEAAR